MPELILMRHANALPAAVGGSDFERPLSARGREAAAQAARKLRTGSRPERVLYSPARRTQETAAIVALELALDSATLQPVPELYAASPRALREAIERLHGGAGALMVVGHNPGISEFGQQLSKGRSHEQLPTAGFWRIPIEAGTWHR